MKVRAGVRIELTPKELGESLAGATPSEFAAFWFAFYEATKDTDMRPFAQAMAVNHGGNRKKPLQELCRLMEYFETDKALEEIHGKEKV